MNKWKKQLFAIVILSFFFPGGGCLAGDASSLLPCKNTAGKKWRIGYYQGGFYKDYRETLIATIEGLMDLGWIHKEDVSSISDFDNEAIWEYVSTKLKSDCLHFVRDAFFSADWSANLRKITRRKLIGRLNREKDIDLMIAMGTWAGQDLANHSHHTNTLVMSASDALSSGIVKSVDYSGFDHVHAHLDPDFYDRQLRIFQRFYPFQKLGVIYEDSVAGRSYAGVEYLEKATAQYGFQIVTCTAQSDIPDVRRRMDEYIGCMKNMADKIDAIYIAVHGGVNDVSLPIIVDIALKNGIVTFSQSGHHEVAEGVLISVSREDFSRVGLFEAATLAKVLNGAKPGEQVQAFRDPPHIAINLNTAEKTGIYLTADELAAADVIFH